MPSYHQPTTLAEAIAHLKNEPNLTIVAGATDIYPARTARVGWGAAKTTPDVLDITRIPALRGIQDRGDHWWMGAATTWTDIVRVPLPPLFDGLKAAAREIGGIQIQNRGTLGGNICTASPAGDSIPCLLSLDAEIECVGGVVFRVTAEKFFTGYRRTAVSGMGELVTGVRIPKHPGRGHFLKLGARRYLVISIAMVAGTFDVDAHGIVRSARIAVGACTPVATRLTALEQALIGGPLDAARVDDTHVATLTPIDDIRASGAYRRAAALQLVRDLVAQAAISARGST